MLRACWFALLLLLAPCVATAQDAAVVIGVQDRYDLSHAFEWLEDSEGTLTLDDIRQPARQARFQRLQQSGPGANFGLTRSAMRLRVKLRAEPQSPWPAGWARARPSPCGCRIRNSQ